MRVLLDYLVYLTSHYTLVGISHVKQHSVGQERLISRLRFHIPVNVICSL